MGSGYLLGIRRPAATAAVPACWRWAPVAIIRSLLCPRTASPGCGTGIALRLDARMTTSASTSVRPTIGRSP